MKYFSLLFVILFSFACDKGNDPIEPSNSTPPNILLIIADDIGKDAISGYEEGTIKANTPHLDALRQAGLTFNNLWVTPTCSPTRASIITGKYGYRTGVKWAGDELDQSEMVLHRYIQEETGDAYSTGLIGKWHLSDENTTSGITPESFGIDYYAGLLRGAVQSYYQWQLTENEVTTLRNEYITEVFTDLSIDWINSQSTPWFLWLAYNAPHTPFHAPPSEMHSQGNLSAYTNGVDPVPYYMAAIEAMDFQIGRLLSEIPQDELDNTIIIFLGDNGTPIQVAQSPYSSSTAKGSLYQGGINVPMFIAGKGVDRIGEENNLICGTDLYSTIAELAGVNIPEIHDSKSFITLLTQETSLREFQYSEMDDGVNDAWAIGNGEYKLIVDKNGNDELYNLSIDPYEQNDLISGGLTVELEEVKAELQEELSNIRK